MPHVQLDAERGQVITRSGPARTASRAPRDSIPMPTTSGSNGNPRGRPLCWKMWAWSCLRPSQWPRGRL